MDVFEKPERLRLVVPFPPGAVTVTVDGVATMVGVAVETVRLYEAVAVRGVPSASATLTVIGKTP